MNRIPRVPRKVSKLFIGLMVIQYLITAIGLVTLGMEYYEYTTIKGHATFQDHVEHRLAKRWVLNNLDSNSTSTTSMFTNTTGAFTTSTTGAFTSTTGVGTVPSTDSSISAGTLRPRWTNDPLIRGCTDNPDDETECTYESRQRVLTVFLLSLIVGSLGVGRCVAGFWCIGITKCLTCGGCGIWWLLDWIFILALVWMRSADGCCFQDNMGL